MSFAPRPSMVAIALLPCDGRAIVKFRYPCSGLAPVHVFHSVKGFRRR